MLSFLNALSRRQKGYVFLGIDLALIPVALLFTFVVQSLPMSPIAALWETGPILPYLVASGAGLSLWLGIPQIQLNAYERHAIGLTAIFALLTAGASAVLSALWALPFPPGTHRHDVKRMLKLLLGS